MTDDLTHLAASTACAFVALVMARAALHKVGDITRFEGVLADYDLVPEAGLRVATRLIPMLEVACAVTLVLAPLRAFGVAMAAGLLAAYAAAMGVNLLRGRSQIDCGCGGPPESLNWRLVARNLGLVTLLGPAVIAPVVESGWRDGLVIWALAATAFLGWGAIEQLMTNADRMSEGRRIEQLSSFGAAQ